MVKARALAVAKLRAKRILMGWKNMSPREIVADVAAIKKIQSELQRGAT